MMTREFLVVCALCLLSGCTGEPSGSSPVAEKVVYLATDVPALRGAADGERYVISLPMVTAWTETNLGTRYTRVFAMINNRCNKATSIKFRVELSLGTMTYSTEDISTGVMANTQRTVEFAAIKDGPPGWSIITPIIKEITME